MFQKCGNVFLKKKIELKTFESVRINAQGSYHLMHFEI